MKKMSLILIITALFLVSCEREPSEELRILLSQNEEASAIEIAAMEYGKSHNIHITVDKVPFFSIKPYLLSGNKDQYDITLGVADWAGELYQKGGLYPADISDVFSEEKIFRINNISTGVIKELESPIFFFYSDRFEKYPEDIHAIFSHLGKGFMYDVNNMYYNMYLACFFGNGFLTDSTYDLTHPDMLEYLDFIDEFRDKVPDSVNYDAVVNLFASGELDIILDGSWNSERHINNGAEVLNVFPKKFFAGAKVYFFTSENIKKSKGLVEFLISRERKENTTDSLYSGKDIDLIPAFLDMKSFFSRGNELFYRIWNEEEDIDDIVRRVIEYD